ncbi:MAG: ATP-binding protein [Rhodanobacteraceae bacterium]
MGILDRASRLCWVNPALGELLGSAGRRLHGEPLNGFDAASPTLSDAATRAFVAQRRVLMRGARLAGAEGEVAADLAFTPIDSDRLLLELSPVAQSYDGTSRLSESLRGFAHEVKNPLAGVRGAAQLLSRRVQAPDLTELTGIIIAEADRLAALADRLLRTGGKPRLARMNIHELLERLASLIAAEPNAPTVRRDYDPSLPALIGDSDRLHQLLLNLARNAIEAKARNIVLLTRAQHGTRVGDRGSCLALRVEVQDDGCGVPPELADSLFRPLVSGRADGSGLGLALAAETAREHGGELRYASRAGATVFTLLLPLSV